MSFKKSEYNTTWYGNDLDKLNTVTYRQIQDSYDALKKVETDSWNNRIYEILNELEDKPNRPAPINESSSVGPALAELINNDLQK